MFEKKFYKNLNLLKNKINFSAEIETQEINSILKWLKNRNLKNKMNVQKIKVNQLKDWSTDKKGGIYHKSKQFFQIEAIKIHSAIGKEVSSWDQPILTQKHGGILAIFQREKENGIIEFLLLARREAGDNHIKLCPSFSATQSNINLAHKGGKTLLTDIVLNHKKSNLIAKTLHYEEGARFWQDRPSGVRAKAAGPSFGIGTRCGRSGTAWRLCGGHPLPPPRCGDQCRSLHFR